MGIQNDSPKGKAVAAKFGVRLRQLRQQAKLTQEQLSSKTGLHVTYISGLERGHRNPTLTVLVSLAKALGLSLSQLFDEKEALK